MRVVADLHLHGRFAQGCSRNTTFGLLEEWARKKGVGVLGTGDIAHPLWRKDALAQLKDENGTGIYRTKTGFPFVLQMEISLVYTHLGKGRRVHHVLLFPSMAVVEQVVAYLLRHGRLDYDGRPIFKITSEDLVRDLRAISPGIEVIPAHIWTPWFAMYGSNSGYDSFKDCFGSQAGHVHAIETGMSSDPAMNWRVPDLDEKQILSFSDSHSYWPWRLGREATLFELPELTYEGILKAVRTGKGLAGTLETEPAYGKYHWDGHRACGFSCGPAETKRLGGICPVCKKPLTIGVDYRVEELASRPQGFVRKGAPKYWKLLPLHELIASAQGSALVTGKKTWAAYQELLAVGKDELSVLLDTPREELTKVCDERVLSAIMANREQRVKVEPGYDGEYGRLVFDGVRASPAAEEKTKKEEKGAKRGRPPKSKTLEPAFEEKKQKGLQDFFS
jgi:uncharacterized protein (TIGR00375 family)